MTDQLEPLTNRRMRDLEAQRDAARDIALVLEEANEKALRLHTMIAVGPNTGLCVECQRRFPCPTLHALTGADEDGAA